MAVKTRSGTTIIIRIMFFILLIIIVLLPSYYISKLNTLIINDEIEYLHKTVQHESVVVNINNNNNYSIYQYDRYCNDGLNSFIDLLQIDGLYHTGTNWLNKQLSINCDYTHGQPPWHKHYLITIKLINKWMTDKKREKTLSIILIKHPLAWFKSYCKMWYQLRPFNITWYNEQCPSNIHLSTIWWNHPPINKNYSSIVHIYNAWYEHYINAKILNYYKFLIVRYEDLLFYTKQVTTDLCFCLKQNHHHQQKVILNDINKIKIYSNASKWHGRSSNLKQAQIKYSNSEYIYEKYTKQDIQYIDKNINHYILNLFNYHIDVTKGK